MEKKNRYHPQVRLGELYVILRCTNRTEHRPGNILRVIDGGVYGPAHTGHLYFAPIDEPVGIKPQKGHTGFKLTITPYIPVDWETIAKEMLG